MSFKAGDYVKYKFSSVRQKPSRAIYLWRLLEDSQGGFANAQMLKPERIKLRIHLENLVVCSEIEALERVMQA